MFGWFIFFNKVISLARRFIFSGFSEKALSNLFVANNSLYPVGGELINYENEALNGTQIAGVSAWCSNKDENGNCIAGTCDNTLGKDGRSCAGRIVEEGMRIRYLK